MTQDDKRLVKDAVENEGFDYCFKNYSHFDEVEDKKFHELREAYLASRQALADYFGLDED
jgi:hypothetical protein